MGLDRYKHNDVVWLVIEGSAGQRAVVRGEIDGVITRTNNLRACPGRQNSTAITTSTTYWVCYPAVAWDDDGLPEPQYHYDHDEFEQCRLFDTKDAALSSVVQVIEKVPSTY